MKRNVLLSSAIVPAAFLATGAMAQISSTNVVNFHNDDNGQAVNSYNELFAGQGAYPDTANGGMNIWNGFSVGNGFEGQSGYFRFYSGNVGTTGAFPVQPGNPGNPYAAYNTYYSTYSGWKSCTGTSLITTTGITSSKNSKSSKVGDANSAGLAAGVTLAVNGLADDVGLNYLYSTSYAVNGTPLFLLGEAGYNSDVPTAQETFTLGKVPVGTYGLFLYGARLDGSGGNYGGVNFNVRTNASTGISFSGLNGITNTLNGPFGTQPNTFILGNNFVVFTNIQLTTSGSIYIYATPNTNQLTSNGAGPEPGVSFTNITTNVVVTVNPADLTQYFTNETYTANTWVGNDSNDETDVNGMQLVWNPPPTALLPTKAQNVYAGGTASFLFTPCFFTNTPAYKWRSIISGVTNNLTDTTLGDGAIITGSATTNLTIANVTAAEVGLYQCVLSNNVANGRTNWTVPAPLTLLVDTDENIFSFAGFEMAEINNNFNPPINVVPPWFGIGAYTIVDGDLAMWENFGRGPKGETAGGFVGPVGVTAVATAGTGYTVASGMRFLTSWDHPESDPANYSLDGSTDGVTWTHIAGGPITLPTQRNWGGGPADASADVLKEVTFANSTPYLDYRIMFTNIVNATTASNGLQIAEVEILGAQDNTAVPVKVITDPAQTTAVAGNVATFTCAGFAGYGVGNDVSYQWEEIVNGVAEVLTNGVTATGSTISGATTDTLTISDVFYADMGEYACVITAGGSVTTTSASLNVTVGPTATAPAPEYAPVLPLTYSPIPITNASFTWGAVIPAGYPYKFDWQSISASLFNGPALQQVSTNYYSILPGYTFFESNFNSTYGLPVGGSTLNDLTTAVIANYPGGAHSFTLPYWTNWNSNCVFLGNYVAAGTYNGLPLTEGPYLAQDYTGSNAPINLALDNSTPYNALSLLVSAAGGTAASYKNSTNNLVIQYNDGSSQIVNGVGFPYEGAYGGIASPYTNATVNPPATFAYSCTTLFQTPPTNGPIGTSTAGSFQATGKTGVTGATNARVWSVDIALNNTTAAPTNIQFFYVSGTNGVVFAVSGSQNAADSALVPNTAPLAGPFAPIAVSGFNAGCVVAAAPKSGLYAPITAMINTGPYIAGGGGTLFEAGYDVMAPANGMPAAGSTITSAANPNATYTLPPTYWNPNAVMVSINGPTKGPYNITPINPFIASSCSFLTVSAYVGNGDAATNYVLIQHADGSVESNWFFGHDWYTDTDTACIAYNTAELAYLGASYSGDRYPGYLYLSGGCADLMDSPFGVTNTTSPITNLVVGFYAAPTWATNCYTTFIFALSASTQPTPLELVGYSGSQTVAAGGNASFSASVNAQYLDSLVDGEQGLTAYQPTFQWQFISNAVTFNLADGPSGNGSTYAGSQTGNLEIDNVSSNDIGYYSCLITNPYPSSIQTPQVSLQVIGQPPQFTTDLEASYTVVTGYPITLGPVAAVGATPITYQWSYNSTPILDATNTTLTIASAIEASAGNYQVVASNPSGSTASTVAVVSVSTLVEVPDSTALGANWNLNGSGAVVTAANALELTQGWTDATVAAFYNAPVYLGAFQANFTYTDVGGTVFDGQGACFVVQNDPNGVAAIGSGTVGGGNHATGFGYGTNNPSTAFIANSFAVEMNISKLLNIPGIAFGTNGSITAASKTEGNITNSLMSGDPINVTVLYDGTTLTVSMVDSISNTVTYSASTAINLPAVLGSSTGYVGFTASTDEMNASTQVISNFEFQNFETLTLAITASGSDLVISWPDGTSCQLQVSTDLINWTDVTIPIVVTAGNDTVTVPMADTQQYFRLLQVQ